MSYFVLVLIGCVILSGKNTSTIAKSAYSDIELSKSEYIIKREINTENGLPANGVSMIIQDSKGYIWAPTFNGLVRYGGKRIVTYNSVNVPGLETNRFTSVMEDRHGRIWAGLEYSSFVMFDGNKTKVYRLDPDIAETNTYITSLFINGEEGIWIGTNSGLYYYHNGNYSKIDGMPRAAVQSITEINGEIYVLFENSLFVNNNSSQNFKKILEVSDNNIHHSSGFIITEFDVIYRFWNIYSIDDRYMVVHENGIFSFNDDGYEIHLYNWQLNQSALHGVIKNEELIYVYGADGLYEIENFYGESRSAKQLSDIRITYMTIDLEGTIWVSTFAQGIIQMISTPVNQGNKFQLIAGVPVTAMMEDSKSNLWMGSNCDGLYKFSGTETKRFGAAEGIDNVCVWSVFEDSNGTIWAGTWGGGVYYYTLDADKFVRFQTDEMKDANAILSVFEDSNGNLWFGSFDRGLIKYDGRTTEIIKNKDDENLSAVRMIFEDHTKTLLFATDRGIGYYDGERIIKPEELNQLQNRNYRVIKKDNEGRYWFGSYGGGIFIYSPGNSSRKITTENGLFDNTISQIQFDSANNVWIAGNMGVFFISSAEISRFMSFEIDELSVSRIGVAEGLPTRETTGGFMPSSHFNPVSGELFIPLVQGIAMLQTENMQLNKQQPAILLEEIEINGEVYSSGDIREIPYGANRVIFKFDVLSFKNPEYVQIHYKMTGIDSQWQNASDSREAIYTTMPSGEYQLLVKATNNDGFWSDEILLHTITVTPPFWQKLWFILSIIALLGAVIFGIYQYRLRNIRKMNVTLQKKVFEQTLELRQSNEELKELIDEKIKLQRVLAHDLRNPFTAILGYMELLKSNYEKEQNQENIEIIDMILYSGKNTLNLLENLLQWSISRSGALKIDIKPSNIQFLVDEALESTEAQAAFKNIKVISHIYDPIYVLADNNMIKTVLRNLISNSIKFSAQNENIDIYCTDHNSDIIISVSDNGIGISEDKIRELFSTEKVVTKVGTSGEKGIGIGLKICKEFIDKHDGIIWAENNSHKGTVFKFSLKKASVLAEV